MGSTAGPNMPSCNWTAWLPRSNSPPRRSPRGDVSAITPYLKALDRLDRYQVVASANQAYDDEARKKLMDKINRMAENFGINEAFAAAVHERLKEFGEIPADEPAEAEGQDTDPAVSPDFMGEPNAPEATHTEAPAGSGFFYSNWP